MINFLKRNDKPNKDGLFAVRLRITKYRKRKYIALNIFADSKYWDVQNEMFIIQRDVRGVKQKEENDERKRKNALIDRYRVRAQQIIDDFDRENIDWTLNQFEDAFLNQARKGKVADYFDKHIETLNSTDHFGNSRCYSNTKRLLEMYDPKFAERVFSEIDIRYVTGFDVFLQKRSCNGNTRKYYFKTLRSILNKAIREKEASAHSYPFGKGGFEVAKLEEETAKRYLPQEDLATLKNTIGLTISTEYARKLFLFSYYCYGMAFIDMATLTKANIIKQNDGNYIVYKRHKIKHQKNVKPIQIKITPEIETILRDIKTLANPVGEYLLPIITINDTGERLYNHIRERCSKCNRNLSCLAKELGFEGLKLTTYVSRHTMAMTLQSNNVPREVISQIMGHSDMETTNTYLDSFETNIINEAVKVL